MSLSSRLLSLAVIISGFSITPLIVLVISEIEAEPPPVTVPQKLLEEQRAAQPSRPALLPWIAFGGAFAGIAAFLFYASNEADTLEDAYRILSERNQILSERNTEQRRELEQEWEREEGRVEHWRQLAINRPKPGIQEAAIVRVEAPFGSDPEAVASEVAYQLRGEREGFDRVRIPSPPDWQALQLAVELCGGSNYWQVEEVVRRVHVPQIPPTEAIPAGESNG